MAKIMMVSGSPLPNQKSKNLSKNHHNCSGTVKTRSRSQKLSKNSIELKYSLLRHCRTMEIIMKSRSHPRRISMKTFKTTKKCRIAPLISGSPSEYVKNLDNPKKNHENHMRSVREVEKLTCTEVAKRIMKTESFFLESLRLP
jgi:hypothetical protein